MAACFALIPGARAASVPKGDGTVRVHVYHTDEFAEIRYAREGEWLPDVDEKLRKLFRSRADDKEFVLDRRLIELADHLQDRFGADTVEVISAYRSPEFNESLKESGHNVARESFHMKGQAMDVHLDEIREDALRDYLLSLKLGGVGYYGGKLMVHMDFGPVRSWQDGGFTENTGIGVFNEAEPLKLKTDKLNYELNSRLTLLISKGAAGGGLALQKYFRGAWIGVGKADGETPGNVALNAEFLDASGKTPSPYGKYRFRWTDGERWQNSNEFYVKRP